MKAPTNHNSGSLKQDYLSSKRIILLSVKNTQHQTTCQTTKTTVLSSFQYRNFSAIFRIYLNYGNCSKQHNKHVTTATVHFPFRNFITSSCNSYQLGYTVPSYYYHFTFCHGKSTVRCSLSVSLSLTHFPSRAS